MQEQVTQGRWTIPDLAIIAFAGLVGSILGAGIGAEGDVILVLLGQFLLAVVAMVLVGKARQRDFGRLAFVVETRDGVMLLLGMGLQVLFAILFQPLALLVGLESEPQSLVGEVAIIGGTYDRITLILLIGLIGPILEETMFRGLLIDALAARFQKRGIVLGSSAAFAAFHLAGISTVQPLESAAVLIPQLFLFAVVLAHLRLSRKRLGAVIFTHAGFNLLSLIVILFYPQLL